MIRSKLTNVILVAAVPVLASISLLPAQRAFPQMAAYSAKIKTEKEQQEYRVRMRARGPNTSWEIGGRPAAMLRVTNDGRYDQHVFLFQGPNEADYEFITGPMDRGTHELRLQWDRSWTPELEEAPEIINAEFLPIDRSETAAAPILRAPIIHLREDTVGRFSDVPLFLYWESESTPRGKRLTYTVILSSEDAGTGGERLMAQWGRTADIEWCYSLPADPGGSEATYQGRDHQSLPFRGAYEAWHPVLYDAAETNTFADSLPAPPLVRVRMMPVEANLAGRARESVMDRFPWIYAISAKEMEREGKLEYPADPKTAKLSDPRNYAILEVCAQQNGTELAFELHLRGSASGFRSDHGDSRYRISRNGCFRSSIELPPGTRPEDLYRLEVHCSPAPVPEGEKPVPSPISTIESVGRLFLLQQDHRPGPNLILKKINRGLKPGRSMTIDLTGH